MIDAGPLKHLAEDLFQKGVAAGNTMPMLSERLIHFSNKDNGGWYSETFKHLLSELIMAYGMFGVALKTSDVTSRLAKIPLISWRARNLLELCVWTVYCAYSEKNTRTFYDDKGRDVSDLFKALTVLTTKFADPDAYVTVLAEAKKRLHERAAELGMSDVDKNFTPVHKAALMLGWNDFGGINKLLSKFTHPTAMIVLAGLTDPQDIEDFGSMTIVVVVPFFLTAMLELESFLAQFQTPLR
ncbi:MAG: hypothetical protein M3Y27_08605 [Acidobacteriota bacterium]|nr:hypothetical protein [Acidobacteriota bacterium]